MMVYVDSSVILRIMLDEPGVFLYSGEWDVAVTLRTGNTGRANVAAPGVAGRQAALRDRQSVHTSA